MTTAVFRLVSVLHLAPLPGADRPVVVPAVKVTAVDSTGAGDAFCGAFAVVRVRTGDSIEAAAA